MGGENGQGKEEQEEEDSDDENRGLPSFRISKARSHKRGGGLDGDSKGSRAVQPLAGPSDSAGGGIPRGGGAAKQQQPVANLLDLDDLFGGGGGGGDGGVPAVSGGVPAGIGAGAATVDLMADIFAAPLAPSSAAVVTKVRIWWKSRRGTTVVVGLIGGCQRILVGRAVLSSARDNMHSVFFRCFAYDPPLRRSGAH